MTLTTYNFLALSNRLPVERQGSGDDVAWRSLPGGLVTAMKPVMQEQAGAWIGWAGVLDEEISQFSMDRMEIVPVQISSAEFEEFYEGFSNDALWPLYHDLIVQPRYESTWWEAYVRVNRRFADRAAELASQGAQVWVHDYQLQLVPMMLRESRPDLVIGFFDHIPFPPASLFAQLPWREEILRGLLGADVLGFQRTSDVQHFREAVLDFLEIDADEADGSLKVDERSVVAEAFPISLDSAQFFEEVQNPAVAEQAERFREQLGNPSTILLGLDRLDYTKGIPNRLEAYGSLLASGSISARDVRLVQLASPSREGVAAYAELSDEIARLVGTINGAHGDIGVTPVTYLRSSYPRIATLALLKAADVMLVTPLRDGMNLVAKEYVTAHEDSGVLVLSEFAGAADEFEDAVIVNPHDSEHLAEEILRAITMPASEQAERMTALHEQVMEHDVHLWAQNFLRALELKAGR
ncbi:alpha,alpha-trehalose-phosphate synthase (UDP-forming) [Humidisolicoccus flavus]|uniref:alpha,alpha-trehalose-phosphate synthase (UDP-forming) n=1 Tax=Humidisolicoccus flavus TaxID=3111414 RepID=UPI0032447E37